LDPAEQILPPEELAEGGERFSDVEFTRTTPRVPVFTKYVYPAGPYDDCVPESGGVYGAVLGVGPISEGGLLRCPRALALVPGRAEILVADSRIGSFGVLLDGRIVRLTSSGAGIWTQSIFVDAATLDGEVPLAMAFVPEPAGGALAAAVLATLGLLARKRVRLLSAVLAAVLMALGVASHAAPLQRGDLLVTDPAGDRVMRVDSAGRVETFSPPPGGADLLRGPFGVTVVDDGPVFVIDGMLDGLIEIDRTTGIQSLAQDSSGLGPVEVGDAVGIDHFVRPTGLVLYVTAEPGLWLVAPNLDFGGYDSALLSDVPLQPYGVGVRPDATGLDVEEVWLGTSGDGLWTWRAGTGAEQVLPDLPGEESEVYLDVEFTRTTPRVPVFTKYTRADGGGCVPGSGGVFAAVLGVEPISQGGLLRCPRALALAPGRAEIFVADTDFTGGDGRIVRLASSGAGIWTQSIFVDAATLDVEFPDGIAFVPEPAGGALAAAVLATLALLARERVPRRTAA
jgi:hypothetical protein